MRQAAQRELSERAARWVCVSSLDGPNRVFVAEQILHATAKDIASCIGIPDGYYLSIQNKYNRVKLEDEIVVLETYPELVLDQKPDSYDVVDCCLYVAPWEFYDIITFVSVRIPTVLVSPLPIGVKLCEASELTGKEFFQRCIQAFGGEASKSLLKNTGLLWKGMDLLGGVIQQDLLPNKSQIPIEFTCAPSDAFNEWSRANRMLWSAKMMMIETNIIEKMQTVLEWGQYAREFFTSDEWNFLFGDVERIIAEHSRFTKMLENKHSDMTDITYWKAWAGNLPWETDRSFLINTAEALSLIMERKGKRKLLFGKKKEYASVNYGFLESVYSSDQTRRDVTYSYVQELTRILELMEPWNPSRELIRQAILRIAALNKTVHEMSHCLFFGSLKDGKERLQAPAEIVRIPDMRYCFDDFKTGRQSFINSLEGLHRLSRLCEGIFGRTDLYKSEDGVKYCVKTLKSKCMPAAIFEELRHREPQIMKEIEHPCFVRFVGSVDSGSKYMIITEYLSNGSVGDSVYIGTEQQSRPVWWNSTTKTLVLVGMLLGLRYLHQHGHVHGMLYPSAILLDEQHLPRITNYGTGGALMSDIADRPLPADLILAPEIAEGHVCNEKTDLYYFGATALLIMIGHGFWTQDFKSGFFPSNTKGTPSWFIEVLVTCVSRDPASRSLSPDDILNTMRGHGFKVWDDVSENDVLDYLHAVERWELYHSHK